jgi:hypothetical protein
VRFQNIGLYTFPPGFVKGTVSGVARRISAQAELNDGPFVFYAWPAGAQDVTPSVPHHVCNDSSRLGEQVQATSAIRHDPTLHVLGFDDEDAKARDDHVI